MSLASDRVRILSVALVFKMNIFQYPNQNDVLLKNTERYEMERNVGKSIRFLTYDKKGLIDGEKAGKIVSVLYPDYVVECKQKRYFVSVNDYVDIF